MCESDPPGLYLMPVEFHVNHDVLDSHHREGDGKKGKG